MCDSFWGKSLAGVPATCCAIVEKETHGENKLLPTLEILKTAKRSKSFILSYCTSQNMYWRNTQLNEEEEEEEYEGQ